jgi:hypothetical protein
VARTPTVTPTPIAIFVVLSLPPSLSFCEPAGDDVADEDCVLEAVVEVFEAVDFGFAVEEVEAEVVVEEAVAAIAN